MCTALTLASPSFLFGRNLDLVGNFGERGLFVSPKYPLRFSSGEIMNEHPSMLGIGARGGDFPLFAEAISSAGLAVAGLNYPGLACFSPKGQVAQYEFIAYVLAHYKKAEEAASAIKGMLINDHPFAPKMGPAPLHYLVSDAHSSFVIEQEKDGMHVYPNPYGILTNSPGFCIQKANLDGFSQLRNSYVKGPYAGLGYGAVGLPGDNSPLSRFVRLNFYKKHLVDFQTLDMELVAFFHLLSSVRVVEGSTLDENGQAEETIYSSCYEVEDMRLFVQTKDSLSVKEITFDKEKEGFFDLPLDA